MKAEYSLPVSELNALELKWSGVHGKLLFAALITLHCAALLYFPLHCAALCHTELCHTALRYTTLHRTALRGFAFC
jgi:hypothetical protein